MTVRKSSNRFTAAGLFFSIVFSGAFLCMTGCWLVMAGWISTPETVSLEKTLKRMQTISQAQERYYVKSTSVFGQKQYAAFLPHLWITPDLNGKPVHMNLIPKKMALAMGRDTTLDGYYFEDVHQRYLDGRGMENESHMQWTVAAIPAEMPRTGFIIFLADESGKVFTKSVTIRPDRFPLFPEKDGWQVIENPEDLKHYSQ